MRDLQAGDHVLDTDGAHWVDALTVRPDAPGLAPDGPTGAVEGSVDPDAYDQSPYVAPGGYVTLTDVPWVVPAPREYAGGLPDER